LVFVLGASLPLVSAVNSGAEVSKAGHSVARTSRHMATGTSHIMHKGFAHRTTGSANRVTTKRTKKWSRTAAWGMARWGRPTAVVRIRQVVGNIRQ
jgi:hypothetical protein